MESNNSLLHFEKAQETVFRHLSILTQLVARDPVSEKALIELTGCLLAAKNYNELKPYILILDQLPSSWPHSPADSPVILLIVKQLVAFYNRSRYRSHPPFIESHIPISTNHVSTIAPLDSGTLNSAVTHDKQLFTHQPLNFNIDHLKSKVNGQLFPSSILYPSVSEDTAVQTTSGPSNLSDALKALDQTLTSNLPTSVSPHHLSCSTGCIPESMMPLPHLIWPVCQHQDSCHIETPLCDSFLAATSDSYFSDDIIRFYDCCIRNFSKDFANSSTSCISEDDMPLNKLPLNKHVFNEFISCPNAIDSFHVFPNTNQQGYKDRLYKKNNGTIKKLRSSKINKSCFISKNSKRLSNSQFTQIELFNSLLNNQPSSTYSKRPSVIPSLNWESSSDSENDDHYNQFNISYQSLYSNHHTTLSSFSNKNKETLCRSPLQISIKNQIHHHRLLHDRNNDKKQDIQHPQLPIKRVFSKKTKTRNMSFNNKKKSQTSSWKLCSNCNIVPCGCVVVNPLSLQPFTPSIDDKTMESDTKDNIASHVEIVVCLEEEEDVDNNISIHSVENTILKKPTKKEHIDSSVLELPNPTGTLPCYIKKMNRDILESTQDVSLPITPCLTTKKRNFKETPLIHNQKRLKTRHQRPQKSIDASCILQKKWNQINNNSISQSKRMISIDDDKETDQVTIHQLSIEMDVEDYNGTGVDNCMVKSFNDLTANDSPNIDKNVFKMIPKYDIIVTERKKKIKP